MYKDDEVVRHVLTSLGELRIVRRRGYGPDIVDIYRDAARIESCVRLDWAHGYVTGTVVTLALTRSSR